MLVDTVVLEFVKARGAKTGKAGLANLKVAFVPSGLILGKSACPRSV